MCMKLLLKHKVLRKSLVLLFLTWVGSIRMFYHQPLADRHYAPISIRDDSAELRPNCPVCGPSLQCILYVCCWILIDLFLSQFCLGTYSFICSFTQRLQHSFTHSLKTFNHWITHSLLHSDIIFCISHSKVHALIRTLTYH